jgi:hypothetical protein
MEQSKKLFIAFPLANSEENSSCRQTGKSAPAFPTSLPAGKAALVTDGQLLNMNFTSYKQAWRACGSTHPSQ